MKKEELLTLIDKARQAVQVVPKDNYLYGWWQRRLSKFTKIYRDSYGEEPRIEKQAEQQSLF